MELISVLLCNTGVFFGIYELGQWWFAIHFFNSDCRAEPDSSARLLLSVQKGQYRELIVIEQL